MQSIKDVVESLQKSYLTCHIESTTENVTYDGFDGYGPEIENRSLQVILYDPHVMSYRVYIYEMSRVIGSNDPGEYILIE